MPIVQRAWLVSRTKTMSKHELVSSFGIELLGGTSRLGTCQGRKIETTDKAEKGEKVEKATKRENPRRRPLFPFMLVGKRQRRNRRRLPWLIAKSLVFPRKTASTVILPPNAVAQASAHHADELESAQSGATRAVRLLSADQLVAALSSLTLSGPNAEMACVLVFAIDDLPRLEEQFGGDVAAVIAHAWPAC